MKNYLLLLLSLAVLSCNAQSRGQRQVTKPGVVIPPVDSSRYKMPVQKPSKDTSMNMPVVPMKPGVIPK